jgi:hypothetical protein
MQTELDKNTRAEQSRINGAKSRGPSSTLGKQISSQNALKLGLYSKRVRALSTEEQSDLEALRKTYHREWRPADERQCVTVDQIVDAIWRHLRYSEFETWLADNMMSKMRGEVAINYSAVPPELALRGALAIERLLDNHSSLEQLQRERHSLLREVDRLTRSLRLLQKENPPADSEEVEEKICENEPESLAA